MELVGWILEKYVLQSAIYLNFGSRFPNKCQVSLGVWFLNENITEMNHKFTKIPVFFRSYVDIEKLQNTHFLYI